MEVGYMDRNIFIKQATNLLNEMNISYKIGDNADISISARFKKQQDKKDDDSIIVYFALLFLNQEKNTVYAYEKVISGNEEISKNSDYGRTIVKNLDDSVIVISSILESIASIANSMGFAFEKTDDDKIASYPQNYIPSNPNISAFDNGYEKQKRFCMNCGAKIENNTRFCSMCGSDSRHVNPPQSSIQEPKGTFPDYIKGQPSKVPYPVNTNMKQQKPKRKTPVALTILSGVLLISILVVLLVVINKKGKESKPTSDQTVSGDSTLAENTSESIPTSISVDPGDSSVVSIGVQSSDLGNIMNGQYYFATKEYIFYSSFDKNDKAHIYSIKRDGTELKPIFDGFGWSLVVIEDWLYFSGNKGEAIDGTYNIFRMKFDGSQPEKITNEYSYGMFLYDTYLYYMKRNPDYQDSMQICRASIDGKNEEVLFPNGFSPLVYKDYLYYYDNQGNMYRTKPDGTDPHVLLTAAVKTYTLSNEKIIYNDNDNNIYTCDLDGGNIKLIRSSKDLPVYGVNAYSGRIFFSEYDPNFNYSAYGYNYTVKSCKIDGSDEKTVFSSISYGIYINLVDNKLMLMDYALNTTGIMNAAIKVMDLDGANVDNLAR